MYSVKEIFYTLQGEGAQSGRAAVFCRFSGCNLWSGREEDRLSADCQFCDTDFVGTDGSNGGKYESPSSLAEAVEEQWLSYDLARRYVVCTGGEPLLQLDSDLIAEFHKRGFDVAIETNGTIDVPKGVDWVCVSPKGHVAVRVRQGDELKLVYPQNGVNPSKYLSWEFDHFFIQPKDGLDVDLNTELSIKFCKENPRWRLGLQTHKVIGVE
jgi:7-carboxy-7-deazaguanine synthase